MNKRFFSIFGAVLLVLCLFATALSIRQGKAWAQGPETSLFGNYPQSDAFDAVVKKHLHPADRGTPALLVSTWFLNGNPAIAMDCRIDTRGKGDTVRAVYNWADQCCNPWQLDAKKLKALQSALRSLPPSSGNPPLDRLLILSCKNDGVWVTRLYDKEHLPVPVQRVYGIVGASVSGVSGTL